VRLDDTRARGGAGSGLGLVIVSEVVSAHGGTGRITDAALSGARVQFTLPRSHVARVSSAEPGLKGGGLFRASSGCLCDPGARSR
jgi:signal transduction histidine kinase